MMKPETYFCELAKPFIITHCASAMKIRQESMNRNACMNFRKYEGLLKRHPNFSDNEKIRATEVQLTM